MEPPMLVRNVADYGQGELAFAEVARRFASPLPEARNVCAPVPPFATLAGGCCAAQLGLNAAPEGTPAFHNSAPREDDDSEREENAGERLAFARLPTGVLAVGVDAGFVYSILLDHATEPGRADSSDAGSRYRSRDLFPRAAADMLRGKAKPAGPLEPGTVPDMPSWRVAYTDGCGNLKLTLTRADVKGKSGKKVRVTVGKKQVEATLSGESFGVPPGTLAPAPGSSGWPLPGGGRMEWPELFLRGGDASGASGRPEPGAEVHIQPQP
jgi:hypothetical protein